MHVSTSLVIELQLRENKQIAFLELPHCRPLPFLRIVSTLKLTPSDTDSDSYTSPDISKLQPSMASAVFFLDLKGKTLLARNYRGDIPMSAVEKFPILLSEAEEESSAVPPCFSDEGINVSQTDFLGVALVTSP